jgi:hypothetical protein
MANIRLRLFPRGFLGGDLKPQVERTPTQYGHPLTSMTYRVSDHQGPNNSITANPFIEALYSAYIKRTVKTNDFNYREAVYKAAFDAFGTKDFHDWFKAQYKSPAAGQLHSDFLADTLEFIMRGRRDMPLENWASLLVITDEGNNIGPYPEKAKEFFGTKTPTSKPYGNRTNMVDILQDWCSKPNGFEDLLGTLHILFGAA